ncbi:MAG TPA: HAD-IIIA family hydrolase [Chlorobiota bacterium]|nr:HAD-IIIA family hydrolase [Chlorobiota bacterium]
MSDGLRPGLLLDRDGIINERIVDGYVTRTDEFTLCDDIVPILRWAKETQRPIAIITNQQGVGKGLMTEADLTTIHDHMRHVLRHRAGVEINAIYVCTSLAQARDPRRKPQPGMILEAIHDLRLDPSQTWFLGDSRSDAEAGRAAGVLTILVGNHSLDIADVVVPTLAEVLSVLQG